MARRRLTAERWRELIEQQRADCLSVTAFCRRHGLALSTYYAWRQRVRTPQAADAPRFVELTATGESGSAREMALIEVRLASGVSAGVHVRVPVGFDAATLRRVVEALQ